ncbi:MAG: hypothetical protein M3Y82_06265 [Verrucomicrobiota bacterium]|nr:hypothetical protein [Verrucomicrobiota bacterium]
MSRRYIIFSVITFIFMLAPASFAQISKGNFILLNRGLQIQGLVTPDNWFHPDTYSNANYTAVSFLWNSTGNLGPPSKFLGPAPGSLWARWVTDETNMPGMGFGQTGNGNSFSRTNEIPYTNQLVSIQLGDEWNLNDDATRTRLVNWFLTVRSNWPNAILYHNNWGGQVGDTQLSDFISRARPDMLCFDTYPWQSIYDLNQPNHTGAPIPGPGSTLLQGWYGYLRQDREYARAFGIPLAIYRQTFHAVQDYDQHIFRDPSPSELRLNTFAAMAFSAKFFSDFTYNTGAASLFTNLGGGSGDTVISSNGLYAEMIDINKRARNFGKALTRLTPITIEGVTGYTTSIMFLRGKDASGNLTPIPSGFLPDPQDQNYTDWVYQRNDPFLNGWSVTNKAGIKNNGNKGDVIIAWFKVMDESFDGPNFNNQIYFMVVNGLTDPTGSAADCLQEIKLNFSNPPQTTAVLLDPVSGLLQTNTMTDIGSGKRQLVLNLNGGDAALFKLQTGAPFVGMTLISTRLNIQLQSGIPAISIQGVIGSRYELQVAPSPPSGNWASLTNLLLPTSPYSFLDTTSSNANTRFYRTISLP